MKSTAKRYNVAVVGATGAVGTQMLHVLEERRFPVNRVRLLASGRSAGRRISFNGASTRVEALRNASFDGIDVALFSAGASRSLAFAPEAVRRGALVVDNSSAFRLTKGVPLVVPEVNAHALKAHRGLVANSGGDYIINDTLQVNVILNADGREVYIGDGTGNDMILGWNGDGDDTILQ